MGSGDIFKVGSNVFNRNSCDNSMNSMSLNQQNPSIPKSYMQPRKWEKLLNMKNEKYTNLSVNYIDWERKWSKFDCITYYDLICFFINNICFYNRK